MNQEHLEWIRKSNGGILPEEYLCKPDIEINNQNQKPKENKMETVKFAVVNLDTHNSIKYMFTHWHETLDEAIAEAQRLAGKDKMRFGVLQLVGVAEIPPQKAEFKRAEYAPSISNKHDGYV